MAEQSLYERLGGVNAVVAQTWRDLWSTVLMPAWYEVQEPLACTPPG